MFVLKAVTRDATLQEILHAIVALSVSLPKIPACNIACNNFRELTHGATSTLRVILCVMSHLVTGTLAKSL